MTKSKSLFAVGAGAIVTAAILLFTSLVADPLVSFGSSVEGQENSYYTVLNSTDAGNIVELKSGSTTAVLANVVISSTSPVTGFPQIVIYEGATTTATTTATIVAEFGTNHATPGTYQYDVRVRNGLFAEVATGFDGEVTVTWK